MNLLKPIIITFLSIVILAWLIPVVSFSSWPTLIVASIVLTILQKVVRPILKILFLPINIVTLGLFSGVINIIILWLVMALVPGFHLDQVMVFGVHLNWFFSLLFISFLLSLIQSGISLIF